MSDGGRRPSARLSRSAGQSHQRAEHIDDSEGDELEPDESETEADGSGSGGSGIGGSARSGFGASEADGPGPGGSARREYGGLDAGAARARGFGARGSAVGGSESDGFGEAQTGGDESVARRIALDALSRTARTRGQLEGLLKKKGIAPEAAAAVLDRFEEVGLIDDVDFAEAFVESRHRIRGQGGRALSMELRRRGVADDVVAEAVGGLSPEREFETACRIARSRYERMSAVAPEVKVRRLAGFLARKGYSGAIVARAVREVVEASAVEAAEALDAMDGVGEEN